MKLPPPPMPALLKTRSTWSAAGAASTSSRNRSTCASSDTSQVWLVTVAPEGAPALARAAVSATASSCTSHAATEQPSAASCLTSSRPIPEPPPVTTASLPANDSIGQPPGCQRNPDSAGSPAPRATLARGFALSGVSNGQRRKTGVRRPLMFIASLVDPAAGFPGRPARPWPSPRHVQPSETQAIAECFISARTTGDSALVALAYRELQAQTDQQFAALTDPRG